MILPSLIWRKICGYFAYEQTLVDLICQEHNLPRFPSEDDENKMTGYSFEGSSELRNFIKNIINIKAIDKRDFISISLLLKQQANLIYNHDNFDQYVYHGRECYITFNRLYQYKCYYIRLDDWDQGNEDDAFLTRFLDDDEDIWEKGWIDFLLEFLNQFKVIHESQFKFQQLLSKKKTIEQTIAIFRILSNQKAFLDQMAKFYDDN